MTIRARLTLWYALVLTAILITFAIASYALLARSSMRRIDQSLEETARAFAAAWLMHDVRTASRLVPPPTEILSAFAVGDLEIVVLDQANGVVARHPRNSPGILERARRPQLLTLLAQVAGAKGVAATLPGDDGTRRAFAIATHVGGRRQVVLVAQGLEEREEMLSAARAAAVLAVIVLLVLALAGGYFLASRALAPVATLAVQVGRIGATTSHERLDAPNQRDELGRLARAFNDLLARLDRALEQQRRFMADASHELRTPIAVVRAEADVALAREARPTEEYRESLDVIRDEARRMSRLVDDLLLLARSDAGADQLSPTDFYLDELVADCVRSVRTLAAERGMTVRYEPDGEMPVRGDEALLRRLVTNLLDNAIKYGWTPASSGRLGGEVVVRAFRDDTGHDVVTVADRGAGIPEEVRDRLFDRFVRGPDGGDRRSEPAAGAGLGLSIARQIAHAHGGSLELTRTGPGGTEFRLILPASSAHGVAASGRTLRGAAE